MDRKHSFIPRRAGIHGAEIRSGFQCSLLCSTYKHDPQTSPAATRHAPLSYTADSLACFHVPF